MSATTANKFYNQPTNDLHRKALAALWFAIVGTGDINRAVYLEQRAEIYRHTAE